MDFATVGKEMAGNYTQLAEGTMLLSWGTQLYFIIRIIVAGICGCVVGLERARRQKEAGIRTHIMVAMGACLLMIISKYGCLDIALKYGFNYDVSRIACNIMPAISFLGAGIIFVKNDYIKGLTTASGVWVMAAIGMAIGSGMYIIGIFSTIASLFVHSFLHKHLNKFEGSPTNDICVTMENNVENIKQFSERLKERDIFVVTCKTHQNDDGTITMSMAVRMNQRVDFEDTVQMLEDNPYIKSLTM